MIKTIIIEMLVLTSAVLFILLLREHSAYLKAKDALYNMECIAQVFLNDLGEQQDELEALACDNHRLKTRNELIEKAFARIKPPRKEKDGDQNS